MYKGFLGKIRNLKKIHNTNTWLRKRKLLGRQNQILNLENTNQTELQKEKMNRKLPTK